MPGLVAKKSQHWNCQQQEWVAFSHGCAGGGDAEIWILRLRQTELAQRRSKLFSNEWI
jgi:hypothetical protein